MTSTHSFDNTGNPYNITRILTAQNTFDVAAYEAYSPIFLSVTFAMSYLLSFASISATITHALVYFRKQIVSQSRRSLREQPDIHARLMSKYPEVPTWWYAIIFVSMTVFGIVTIEVRCECTQLGMV